MVNYKLFNIFQIIIGKRLINYQKHFKFFKECLRRICKNLRLIFITIRIVFLQNILHHYLRQNREIHGIIL